MAILKYEYKMKISYSEAVGKCYFTIKGIPADDFRQKKISYDISLLPPTKYSKSEDSFGNLQLIGCENEPHDVFEYMISGLVETHPVSVSGGIQECRVGMYKYPHGKCIAGETIKRFIEERKDKINKIQSTKDKAYYVMNALYEQMTYETGSTQIETSAEEAFLNKKGVCQDYSHIFITMLRELKIPARYVCGLIEGEGQSHAWVEVVCDGNYVGFDPTHNKEITDEYIKFGVGRDATDCAINRGVMWGGGAQMQDVKVTVERYY